MVRTDGTYGCLDGMHRVRAVQALMARKHAFFPETFRIPAQLYKTMPKRLQIAFADRE